MSKKDIVSGLTTSIGGFIK